MYLHSKWSRDRFERPGNCFLYPLLVFLVQMIKTSQQDTTEEQARMVMSFPRPVAIGRVIFSSALLL